MDIDARIALYQLDAETGEILRTVERRLAESLNYYADHSLPASVSDEQAQRLEMALHWVAGRDVRLRLDADDRCVSIGDPRLFTSQRPGFYTLAVSRGISHRNAVTISNAMKARREVEMAAATAFVNACQRAADEA